MFIYDDLATLCVNLVNFGPVIPMFKRVVGVHHCTLVKNALEQIILRSTWPIITIFLPY